MRRSFFESKEQLACPTRPTRPRAPLSHRRPAAKTRPLPKTPARPPTRPPKPRQRRKPRRKTAPSPWDAEPPPDGPDAPRQRHDAFTEARKSVFLRALVKTGCILDACGLTGISPRTVYRHQENDPAFSDHCRLALRISGTPAEITAWQRAVEGVEQPFACGGQVHVRRRYSDGLLRLLLQGSNPKKYGPNPGFTRKRLLRHERKQMERELRAEIAAKRTSFDQAIGLLDRQLNHMELTEEELAAGWTKAADGHWIPPGYAWVGLPEGGDGPGADGAEGGTPRNSV